jgi:hypothetical protein
LVKARYASLSGAWTKVSAVTIVIAASFLVVVMIVLPNGEPVIPLENWNFGVLFKDWKDTG